MKTTQEAFIAKKVSSAPRLHIKRQDGNYAQRNQQLLNRPLRFKMRPPRLWNRCSGFRIFFFEVLSLPLDKKRVSSETQNDCLRSHDSDAEDNVE